jgi:peptidoglycan L-alanyl-D-glutamate endopeptidase CwlK
METDLLGRINLTHLYPPFLERLEELVDNCLKKSSIYVATTGFRTFEEQDRLYHVGRSNGVPHHVVTNAQAGFSSHNYGVAADLCKHSKDTYEGHLSPDWNDDSYEILAEEAEKLGLESGLRWNFKDSGHIQLDLKKHGITYQMLEEAHRLGRMPEVFALLDTKGPW